MDEQSLWLTTSINVPDPLKTNDDLCLPSIRVVPTSTSAAAACTAPPPSITQDAQPSMRAFRQSSVRLGSVGSTSLISLHEFDELRNRVSQLNREKRLWEDTERALDRMKVEVDNLRQENASLSGVIGTLRSTNATANKRAEADARSREEAEVKLAEFMLKAAQEHQAVKLQLETAVVTAEAKLREEISRRSAQLEEMSSDFARQRAELQSQYSLTQDLLDRRTDECDKVNEEVSAVNNKLCASMQREKEACENLERTKQHYEEQLQTVKALNEEQIHSLKSEIGKQLKTHSNLTSELRTSEEKLHALMTEMELLRKSERDAIARAGASEKASARAAEEYGAKLTAVINDYQRNLEDERRTAAAFNEQISRLQEENRLARDQATESKAALSHNEVLLARTESEFQNQQQVVRSLELKVQQLVTEFEAARSELLELEERYAHAVTTNETLEVETSGEIEVHRQKLDKAEAEVLRLKLLLSEEKKTFNRVDAELREEISVLHGTICELKKARPESSDLQKALRETEARFAAKSDDLHKENMILREQVDELLTQQTQRVQTQLQLPPMSPRPQCALSEMSNKLISSPTCEARTKRLRVEEPRRTFAVTGFSGSEGKSILESLRKLPNCDVVELTPNAPVPSQLTHLISNGQLTVKLLTALARGCWIVDRNYISASAAAGSWLAEKDFGYRHATLPLAKQRIAFTDGFLSSRNYDPASIVAKEGGAIPVTDLAGADLILCHHKELESVPNGVTWEKFVAMLTMKN